MGVVIGLRVNIISVTARTISFEIINKHCFFAPEKVNVYLNGESISTARVNVYTIRDLEPDTEYELSVESGAGKKKSGDVYVKTKPESVVVNVKDFGAKGNGRTIDTRAIQAAIAACPQNGRVLLPRGIYLTGPIFLKSNITFHLEKGSMLIGVKTRDKYPIMPGVLESHDRRQSYYLGSWEGQHSDTFASLINGIDIENVNIIGQGIIDGNADFDTWWFDPKTKRVAWRPRVIFLKGCKNIVCEGIRIKNSPSWTIHPLRSQDLKFVNIDIHNPKDSPNTDGINPESCTNVLIAGVVFSVGDDCIAIKSGKRDATNYINTASENIYIRNCHMKYGHGAVVIGSEMSGGVKGIYVENCLFENTDRGIRIKTRRGRGARGVIDDLYVKNINMNRVLTPFVINAFYNCDVDGKTEYVWTKERLPVDEGTPCIEKIYIENVECMDAQIAAAFVYGLPEKKIGEIYMEDVHIHLAVDAKLDYPAMMDFIEPTSRSGLYFNNVRYLKLSNVDVENALTEQVIMENVDRYEII